MPTNTVKKVWLEDKDGAKIAPKTLVSQVQTADGILLEDKIQSDLNIFKEEVLEEVAQVGGNTEEIEAKIEEHNVDATAHADIRDTIPTKVSDLTNDSGFITSHQDISGKLDKSGGIMTGALNLSGDPTENLQAATKQYVDTGVSSAETAASNAQITANEAKTAAATAQATADTKAPAYTYGTADMTAGSSALETGKLYFVYE